MARFNDSDFKAVIALSVYADWKSKCKENNELMKDSLSNALDAIGYQKPLPMNIEGITHILNWPAYSCIYCPCEAYSCN